MTRPIGMQLRSLAKTSGASALAWSRLSNLFGTWRGAKRMPLVVGYHRVVKDFDRSKSLSIAPMLTSAHTFEKHLDWIGLRYRFVSLDELTVRLGNNKSIGKPVAAVTFDDGYRDVYENAFPILKRKGIPSAVFVVTKLVGTDRLLVHDELHLLLSALLDLPCVFNEARWRDLVAFLDLPEHQLKLLTRRLVDANGPFSATRAILESAPQAAIEQFVDVLRGRFRFQESDLQSFRILDWEMLTEMIASGMTVGSHTSSHAILAHENPQVIRDEVDSSRRVLEQRLGVPIRHFAYPDGQFNADVIRAVADAGYRTAYTICAHRDQSHPLLTISRKMMWENACMNGFGRFSPAILNCQVNGIFDPADACREQH